MITSLYKRGHESASHYKREKSDRSSNWANVPKNKPSKRSKRINVMQHQYEVMHGYDMLVNPLEEILKCITT